MATKVAPHPHSESYESPLVNNVACYTREQAPLQQHPLSDNLRTHPPTLRPTEPDTYRELRMVQPLIEADVLKPYMRESSRFSITPTPHLCLKTQQPPNFTAAWSKPTVGRAPQAQRLLPGFPRTPDASPRSLQMHSRRAGRWVADCRRLTQNLGYTAGCCRPPRRRGRTR